MYKIKIKNNMYPIYKTADIALTATLVANGFQIQGLEFETEKRAWFEFEDTRKLRELVDKYNLRKVRIEPNDFFTKLRDVKTRIYDEKNRQVGGFNS